MALRLREKQVFWLRARRQKRCYAAHSEAFDNAAIIQKAALQPVAHTVFQLQKMKLKNDVEIERKARILQEGKAV